MPIFFSLAARFISVLILQGRDAVTADPLSHRGDREVPSKGTACLVITYVVPAFQSAYGRRLRNIHDVGGVPFSGIS